MVERSCRTEELIELVRAEAAAWFNDTALLALEELIRRITQ